MAPPTITKLRGTPQLAAVTLDWKPVPWATIVDHYAVYVATAGSGWTLLAKTVYPQYVHRGLGAAGVTRSYRVVTVDAAGNRSRPSPAVAVANKTSVTVSGRPIARVGQYDGKGSEFALSPNRSAEYRTVFPAGVDYTYGVSVPGKDWSYLQPGPADSWAGRKNHRFRFRFDLAELPTQDVDLALWLIDSHASIPGSVLLSVNGTEVERFTFAKGATKGSLIADSTYPGSPLKPSYYERPLPRGLFTAGQNVVELYKDEGSWIAFDGFGLYARS